MRTKPLALMFLMIILIVTYPSLNAELQSTLAGQGTMLEAALIIVPITVMLATIGSGSMAVYLYMKES